MQDYICTKYTHYAQCLKITVIFSERPLFVWMLGIATAVALPVVLDPNPLVSAVIGA